MGMPNSDCEELRQSACEPAAESSLILIDSARDGRFELYKTTAEHEGDPGRQQHGFPRQDEVAL